MTKPYRAIDLAGKAGMIQEQWSPRVVAELNDYQLKVVRIEGDFIWHDHPETDEAFLVLDGELRIDFPGRRGDPAAGRALRGAQGGGAQALRRAGSQDVAHRAARHAQHRPYGR
jgi:hypothetical protein